MQFTPAKLRRCPCGQSLAWLPKEATLCTRCERADRFSGSAATTYLMCYCCTFYFDSTLTACPECGAVTNQDMSSRIARRNAKSYADYVRENAERVGRDVGRELKFIDIKRRRNFIGERTNKQMYAKIVAWLRKHHRPKGRFDAPID